MLALLSAVCIVALPVLSPLSAQDTTTTPPPPLVAPDTVYLEAPSLDADGLGFFERFYLDRLRLRGVGFSVGGVKPSQMEAASAIAVHADYGEIVPNWRVIFSATYWGSRFDDDAIGRYRDILGVVVNDPAGDDTIDIGPIRVQDIALAADARWSPQRFRSSFLRPYAGVGVTTHVLNAEGRAIDGTLVERALDNIAAGVSGAVGVDALLVRQFAVSMQLRYDLLSGARYGSLRLGGTYYFDRLRAIPPAVRRPAGADR